MHFEMDCFSSIKYKLHSESPAFINMNNLDFFLVDALKKKNPTFAEHLIPINLKYPFPHTAPDFPSPQTFLAVDATHLC